MTTVASLFLKSFLNPCPQWAYLFSAHRRTSGHHIEFTISVLLPQLFSMDLTGFTYFFFLFFFFFLRHIIILYPTKANSLAMLPGWPHTNLPTSGSGIMRLQVGATIPGFSWSSSPGNIKIVLGKCLYFFVWDSSPSPQTPWHQRTLQILGMGNVWIQLFFLNFRFQELTNYHTLSLGNLISQVQVHLQMNF